MTIESKHYIVPLALFLSLILGTLSSAIGIYVIAIVIVILFLGFYVANINKFFWTFLFLLPFLPNYLSISLSESLPLFSAYRLLLLFFIIDQLLIKNRLSQLFKTIKEDKFQKVILLYGIVVFSVGLYHLHSGDRTAFIGAISILVESILFYYLILMNIKLEKKRYGEKFLDKFLGTLCLSAFILSIMGVIEYITSFNAFTLLETSNVEGVGSSTYIRQGELRVSTSFPHSLGYGLYLLLIIPISYFQIIRYKGMNKNKYYYYSTLFILLLINMFFTSSRSVMLAFFVTFLMFFVMSNLKKKLIIFYATLCLGFPLLAFSITPIAEEVPVISSVGQNIKSLSDTFLGTSMVEEFGRNAEPFTYRKELVSYAFTQQGTENIVGKGIGFIRTEPLSFNLPSLNPYGPTVSNSVDNYYINVKLEQGWVGLAITLILFITVLSKLFINRKSNFLYVIIFISFAGYLSQFFMVNHLETLKYFWILLALFAGHAYQNKDKELTLK